MYICARAFRHFFFKCFRAPEYQVPVIIIIINLYLYILHDNNNIIYAQKHNIAILLITTDFIIMTLSRRDLVVGPYINLFLIFNRFPQVKPKRSATSAVRCTWPRKQTTVVVARVPSALRCRVCRRPTPPPTPHQPPRGVRRLTRSGLTEAIRKTVRRWDPLTNAAAGVACERLLMGGWVGG